MKEKICSALAALLSLLPWGLLLVRRYPWALESPAAELLIGGTAVLMILLGVFTALCCIKGKMRGILIRFCFAVDLLYAAFGAAVLLMMLSQK